MAGTYHTPGVYVEEIASFPASVAAVQTSVPAFVGYTEKVPAPNVPIKIGSILEFEALFGGPDTRITVPMTGTAPHATTPSNCDEFRQHNLWYCMVAYFGNGGGPCYVVSAGAFHLPGVANISKTDLKAGLDKIAPLDEPTLLVVPEAFYLSSANSAEVQAYMLSQAGLLKDRFAIIDAKPDVANPTTPGFSFDDFRTNIGTADLSYGAAYFPEVETVFKYRFDGQDGSAFDKTKIIVELTGGDKTLAAALAGGSPDLNTSQGAAVEAAVREDFDLLEGYAILPPSALIAGIYCSVDRTRGVWKAPANVSLNAIKKPRWKMSATQLSDMNIPVDGSGKAVNAIRTFTGRGHLVWGARTLDGNSNEWRYVPVRRLYNMVEESIKKATEFVVFEPNDANTWTRVRAMIENFLTVIWRQGALAGAKPKEAFFVNVGLGTTMTPLDVLEGRLIVEIGMAAVRPAEFIVLKFSHKLADS